MTTAPPLCERTVCVCLIHRFSACSTHHVHPSFCGGVQKTPQRKREGASGSNMGRRTSTFDASPPPCVAISAHQHTLAFSCCPAILLPWHTIISTLPIAFLFFLLSIITEKEDTGTLRMLMNAWKKCPRHRPCARNDFSMVWKSKTCGAAIQTFARRGDRDLLEWVWESGKCTFCGTKAQGTRHFWSSAFFLACENGHVPVVQFLWSHVLRDCGRAPIFDVSASDNLAFRVACNRGHLGVVHFLWNQVRNAKGVPLVDPTASQNHAFRLACEYGHLAVVQFLWYEVRAPDGAPLIHLTAADDRALFLATRNGHTDISWFLRMDVHDVNGARIQWSW